MKSHLFALYLFLGLFHCASAQDEVQRDYFVGGSVQLHFQDNAYPYIGSPIIISAGSPITSRGDENYTAFAFNPYVGKNISDRWSAGLLANFGISNRNGNYTTTVFPNMVEEIRYKNEGLRIGGGIFLRYRQAIAEPLNFFVQPSLIYSHSVDKMFSEGELTGQFTTNYGDLTASAGLQYALSERVNILLQMNWMRLILGQSEDEENDAVNFSSFTFSASLTNLNFGAEIRL